MALEGEGQAHCINTIEQWREHMERENASQKLVVVDFFSRICSPCNMSSPVAEFTKLMPDVLFLKVDRDVLTDVAEEYRVEGTPHFVFLRAGKMVDRIVGPSKDQLQNALENHAIITV